MDTQTEPTPEQPQGVKQDRPIKWEVKYTYSNDELLELGQRAVRLNENRTEVEARKKSANSQFKLELDRIAEEINQTYNKIGSGYTMTDMDCEVWLNRPEDGLKSYVRPDTGAIVFTTPMTLEERQMLLPLDEEPEPDSDAVDFFSDKEIHQDVIALLAEQRDLLNDEIRAAKGKKAGKLIDHGQSLEKATLILRGDSWGHDSPVDHADLGFALGFLREQPEQDIINEAIAFLENWQGK